MSLHTCKLLYILCIHSKILYTCIHTYIHTHTHIHIHTLTHLLHVFTYWHYLISSIAERKSRRELAAVIVIQRSYRSYLKRMYGSALCDAFLANKYLKFIAAKVCRTIVWVITLFVCMYIDIFCFIGIILFLLICTKCISIFVTYVCMYVQYVCMYVCK